MKDYINRVRAYYIDEYAKNDKAHNIDHVDAVCEEALFILDELSIYINRRVVIAAAYLHDLKCHMGRSVHHANGSEYVLNAKDDEILNEFSSEQRVAIAEAILQHRSSFKGIRSSILSKVLATADMGRVDMKETILRSYKYNSGKDFTFDEIVTNVYDHLKDKFGSKGYRKYSEFYISAYGNIIDAFNKEIDEVTMSEVESVIKTHMSKA